MGKFDPRSLTKEQLDRAVREGRLADYYLDDKTLIKEISMKDGGYILKMVEYVPGADKQHIEMDFIYDANGRLIDKRLHNF